MCDFRGSISRANAMSAKLIPLAAPHATIEADLAKLAAHPPAEFYSHVVNSFDPDHGRIMCHWRLISASPDAFRTSNP
jgi:hypothetical protein